MKLIRPFEISPFCRTIWINRQAKETWSDIIPQISQFVQELEVLSVTRGHRRCAWQTIAEDTLINMERKWAEMGLVTVLVRYVGNWKGFAHKHIDPKPGEKRNACVIVARDVKDAMRFRDAHDIGDNFAQGEELGYPACCSRFFCDTWKHGFYDPIWQAALNSEIIESETTPKLNRLRIRGHPYSNPAMRYIGLRVSFHICHSFSCPDTIKIADQRMGLAREINPNLAKLLEALLRMPQAWDCLNGIAIIRTPIFYVITSSVPCEKRHIVEIEGDFIPKEAEPGIDFPFNRIKR